ncbi:MAG: response regulator [Alphaproteobacteria bacterium]|nr:response regulator [Alphaproteobacteria bacterium]
MSRAAEIVPLDAFEHAPDPGAHLAADGAVLSANAAFRAVFRHVLGSRRPPWGRIEPPPFVGGLRRFDAPAPDGRLYEWAERRLLDGTRIAFARDVSDRADAAREADRAKTLLFATLTHELRTPLNGILGMTGLLAQTPLEADARDYVRTVRQSGEHLLDLINEILDYSRLEAGKIELEDAPFDLEATAQSAAELMSPKAHEKGIEIAVLLRAGAPTHVIGDESRVRQVLFNLVGNAVKFTETGGVTIEIGLPRGGRAGGRVKIIVRDTGPGIAPDKQAEIFGEFSQADATISRRYGGAGLGLAIVKRLAAAMNGQAGVDSRAGEGAAFWMEWPAPFAPAPSAPPQLAAVRAALVARSEVLAQSIGASITGLGGDVVRCTDNFAATGANVIIVDHGAGLDDGAIRALAAGDVPVVALAPQEDRDAVQRFRAAGVKHYVVKPVRRRSLAERLLIAIGRDPGARFDPYADDDREHAPELSGMRVLLAEDNPVNALIARTILTRAGAVVDAVNDGHEAVEAARAAPYDLVILDLRMPRVDGLEAARRLKADGGASAGAPLVALTADAGEGDRRRAHEAGLDDFLTKPIEPARLAAVAARFTARAKAARV